MKCRKVLPLLLLWMLFTASVSSAAPAHWTYIATAEARIYSVDTNHVKLKDDAWNGFCRVDDPRMARYFIYKLQFKELEDGAFDVKLYSGKVYDPYNRLVGKDPETRSGTVSKGTVLANACQTLVDSTKKEASKDAS